MRRTSSRLPLTGQVLAVAVRAQESALAQMERRGAGAPRVVTHCVFVFSTDANENDLSAKQAVIIEINRNLECLLVGKNRRLAFRNSLYCLLTST